MNINDVDGLFVLQRSDVAHIARHIDRLADFPLICTDPGILEELLKVGAKNYELRQLAVSTDFPAQICAEALSRATHIDLLLTRERERLFGPGRYWGWDSSAISLSLQVVHTALALRPLIETAVVQPRVGLLRPDNPLFFNFDSMVQPDILGADHRRWSVVGRYEGSRPFNPLLLSACLDFDGVAELAGRGPVQALTHLATCFYDAPAFADAVTSAFTNNIDLPSVYCDLPVRRENLLLVDVDGLPARWQDERAVIYRERARALFDAQLADLIPNTYTREIQAQAWASRSYLQAINFLGLKKAMAGQRPHIVVADHDNGLLGPLFSLADALDSAVTVMPHSGYTNAFLPHAQRVTAVQRAGYGIKVRTVLGQPVKTRNVNFRSVSTPKPRKSVRRVCLLLNTMYANGQFYIDIFSLRRFHERLRAVCEHHGVELAIRLKPSAPATNVMVGALGVSVAKLLDTARRPIEDVATETDLCIAWAEVTTGSISFLDAGSLVLHVSDEDWAVTAASQMPFLHDGLVTSLHSGEAVDLVSALLADPSDYQARLRVQAQRYAQQCIGAHDDFFAAVD